MLALKQTSISCACSCLLAQGDCCRELGDAEAAAGAYCESVAHLRHCAAQAPEVGFRCHTCCPGHLPSEAAASGVCVHVRSCGASVLSLQACAVCSCTPLQRPHIATGAKPAVCPCLSLPALDSMHHASNIETVIPVQVMAAQVLRALALSTSKLGDLAYRTGDLSTARALYCDALAARRRAFTNALAEPFPEPSALELDRLLPPNAAGFPPYPYSPPVSGDGNAPGRKAAADGAAVPAGGGAGSGAGLSRPAVPLALDLATSLCKLADLDKVGIALLGSRVYAYVRGFVVGRTTCCSAHLALHSHRTLTLTSGPGTSLCKVADSNKVGWPHNNTLQCRSCSLHSHSIVAACVAISLFPPGHLAVQAGGHGRVGLA